jgi:hypothetical protein
LGVVAKVRAAQEMGVARVAAGERAAVVRVVEVAQDLSPARM